MLDHRVEDRLVAGLRAGQAELFGERFLGPQTLARGDSGAGIEPLQLAEIRKIKKRERGTEAGREKESR